MVKRFELPGFLRRAIPLVIVTNIALVLFGVVRYPTVMNEGGLAGICADILILLIYGYLALLSPISVEKIRAGLPGLAVLAGLVGGISLSLDLVSSYIIEHDAASSSISSLVVYGIFLSLLLVSGIFGARSTGKIRSGIAAAIWCALITLLLWFLVEFVSFYIFASTATGSKFLQLEMQADFERSNSQDFQGFVMSDFYGAGFYHLVLGLLFATFLGSTGGLVGKLFYKK